MMAGGQQMRGANPKDPAIQQGYEQQQTGQQLLEVLVHQGLLERFSPGAQPQCVSPPWCATIEFLRGGTIKKRAISAGTSKKCIYRL
jgi:hypothetical protein